MLMLNLLSDIIYMWLYLIPPRFLNLIPPMSKEQRMHNLEGKIRGNHPIYLLRAQTAEPSDPTLAAALNVRLGIFDCRGSSGRPSPTDLHTLEALIELGAPETRQYLPLEELDPLVIIRWGRCRSYGKEERCI